ncbi:hypothetical protein DRQ17_01545, partial [bacterium]
FLPLMRPYAWAWYEWEKENGIEPQTYTPDPNLPPPVGPRYPNKSFLEIINYPNRMTVDSEDIPILRPVWGVEIREPVIQNTGTEWITCEVPIKYDTLGWEHSKGASSLLWERVKEVLEEYYGEDWEDNPDAKVIIVAHSMGGLVTREALRVYPEMRGRIEKVVMIGTPIKVRHGLHGVKESYLCFLWCI